MLQWVNADHEVVGPDTNVLHVREKIGRVDGGNGRILVEKVQGVEEIPDRIYGDVESAGLVNHRPELSVHQATNAEESRRRMNDLVLQHLLQTAVIGSHLAGSEVVDAVRWKCVTINHHSNLRRQTKEVKGLFWPVEEFELLIMSVVCSRKYGRTGFLTFRYVFRTY